LARRAVVDIGGVTVTVGYSDIESMETYPSAEPRVGERVRITAGPHAGVTGRLRLILEQDD
jgi:transcription antitermination factor NusG